MKCKIIVSGLMFLTLLFPNLPVIAHLTEEEVLEKTAKELYDVIMCPICSGQTIAQSSSGTSNQMRNLVLKKLRQGETKEEILQYFESKYGERILAKPSKEGFNLMLWVLPFVIVAFVAIAIYFLVRRWSETAQAETAAHTEEIHLAEYKERLEKELKQFDERS